MAEQKLPPDLEYQHRMDVYRTERAAKAQSFAAHASAVAQFTVLAINSIILANTAAAGAVLVFVGSLWGKKEAAAIFAPATWSASAFAIGVGASIGSAVLTYATQFFYAMADLRGTQWSGQMRAYRIGWVLHVLACLAAIVGVGGFGAGSWYGLRALADANGGLSLETPIIHPLALDRTPPAQVP